MHTFGSVIVIGGGVMGRAIVQGAIAGGLWRAGDVCVVEPEASRREEFEGLGARACAEVPSRGGAGVGMVLLSVKPQVFADVGSGLGERLGALIGSGSCPVVSVMAGVRAERIGRVLGPWARVVRAMPNTPARVGQGVTGIAGGPGATEADVEAAARVFEAVGPLVVRIDEGLMDAFTAVAGSGPAYAFFVAEAMERAAIELGFSAGEARGVVAQTLRGAAALLDGSDPAGLRAAVTSKGGTTAAAIASLDAAGVTDAFVRAITAARDRGRELGA